MPKQSSPERNSKPSQNLALLSALVVFAFNRRWLSGPVQSFIPQGGPSLERLSRLKSRLLNPFEDLVREATRRGRPPREAEKKDESLILRELLTLVPRNTWRYLSRNKRAALVEAQARLKHEHGLTARRFCELLGISERTFRSWQKRTPRKESPKDPPPSPPKKKPPRNTGRFDLSVTLPGIQAMADTSPWELFGVPLQIVSVQDPGARRERLWESFALDTREDSELIIEAVREALEEKPGTQLITDQGKPYMSEATSRVLEELQCDHAPQKEGTPTEKACLERAYRTVKEALEPLSDLTKRLVGCIPGLHRPDLARAVGRILLSVYLRVYEASPREGLHPLNGRTLTELEAIAEGQREKAQAEGRSKRLLLAEIHQAYDFPGSPERTIRAHRRHALEDIQEAERRLRSKACRCVARFCDRYFAGILRNVSEENEKRRRRKRQQIIYRARQEEELRKMREGATRHKALLRDQPEIILEEGLNMVSCHWIPKEGVLLGGGRGLGTVRIREALESMKKQDPHTVRDRAMAVWKGWVNKNGTDSNKVAEVQKVFEGNLIPFFIPPPSTENLVKYHLNIRPNYENRLSTRGSDLRNLEAGCWG